MPEVLTELKLDKIELFSVVDKGASGNANVRPSIVLVKRKKEQSVMGILSKWFGSDGKVKKQELPAGTEKTPEAMLNEALANMAPEQQDAIMAAVAALMAQKPVEPVANADEPKPQDPQAQEVPKMDPNEAMQKIAKNADDETKAAFAVVLEIAKAAQAETSEIKKSLVEMKAEKKRESITRRIDAMKHLPGEPAKIAKALEHLDGTEHADVIEQLLSRADGMIAKAGESIFEELGTSRGEDLSVDDPSAEIARLAKELVRKGDKKLSETEARIEIYNTRPDLVAKMKGRIQ